MSRTMIVRSVPRLIFLTFLALALFDWPVVSAGSSSIVSDNEELALKELLTSDPVISGVRAHHCGGALWIPIRHWRGCENR